MIQQGITLGMVDALQGQEIEWSKAGLFDKHNGLSCSDCVQIWQISSPAIAELCDASRAETFFENTPGLILT